MLLVKSLVALVLVVGLVAAQEEALGPNGQPRPEPYSFKYSADGSGAQSSREETGDANGRITGVYTITGPDGRERRVEYVADADGYRATVKTNEIGTKPEDSGAAHWIVSQPSEAQLAASNNANLLNPNAGKPSTSGGQFIFQVPEGSSLSGSNSQLPTQQEQIASANNQGPAVIAPAEESQQTLVNLDDIIDAPPQELPQQVLVQQQQLRQPAGPVFGPIQAPRPIFQQPQIFVQRQPLGPLPVPSFASRQPAQLLLPQQPVQQVLIQQQQEADQPGQEFTNAKGIAFGRQPPREVVQLIQQQEAAPPAPSQPLPLEPEQPLVQQPLPAPQFGNKGPGQIVQLQRVTIQQQQQQFTGGAKGIALGRQPPRELVQLIQQEEPARVVFNPPPAPPQPLPIEPVEPQQQLEQPQQPLPAPQFGIKAPGTTIQQVTVQQQQDNLSNGNGIAFGRQPPREVVQLIQQQQEPAQVISNQPPAPSQPISNEPQLPEAQFETKEPEQPAPAAPQPEEPESPKAPAPVPAPAPAPIPAPAPLPVPIFTQVQIPARAQQPTKGGLIGIKGTVSGGRQQGIKIIEQPQFIQQIDRPQFIQQQQTRFVQQQPQFIQQQPLFIQQQPQQQQQFIQQQPQQQFVQQVTQFQPQPQFIPQSQLIQTVQEPEILAPNFSFERIRPIQPQPRPQQQLITTQFIQQQQQQPARVQVVQSLPAGPIESQGTFGPLPVKGGSPVRQEPAAPAPQEQAPAQEPAAPQEPASQEPAGQEPAQGPDASQPAGPAAGTGSEQTSQNGDKVEVINLSEEKQTQSQQEENAPKSTETGGESGSQQEAGQTESGSSQEAGNGQVDSPASGNEGVTQEGAAGADQQQQQPQTSAPTTSAPTTTTLAPTTTTTTTTTAAPRRLVFGKGRFGKPAGVKFGTKGAPQQPAPLPAPIAPQPQPLPVPVQVQVPIQQQEQPAQIKSSGSQFVSFGTRLGTKTARAN